MMQLPGGHYLHIPTIEWLMNPDARRAGRSLMLVAVAILTAQLNPGKFIKCFDHTSHHQSIELVMSAISRTCQNAGFKFTINEHSLRIDAPGTLIVDNSPSRFFRAAIHYLISHGHDADDMINMIRQEYVYNVMKA
jgi:hypothetical protein